MEKEYTIRDHLREVYQNQVLGKEAQALVDRNMTNIITMLEKHATSPKGSEDVSIKIDTEDFPKSYIIDRVYENFKKEGVTVERDIYSPGEITFKPSTWTS